MTRGMVSGTRIGLARMPEQHHSIVPDSLEAIEKDFAGIEVRTELRQGLREHHMHLVQLAGRLQKLGLDDVAVDQHVVAIFEQYKTQLLQRLSEASPRYPI